MARGRRTTLSRAQAATITKPKGRAGRLFLTDAVFWDVIAIHSHFEEISFGWAKMLGISIHQWMIIMAIQDLGQGAGVSVGAVSAKLHTDPSIVTTQSKGLEKEGRITRAPSPDDARVVLMSLTPKAVEEIARIKGRRDEIRRAIFEELDDDALNALHATLGQLSEKLERAERRLFAEL